MPNRIRHCVECPKCHTCYLLGFSPYSNGAFLVSAGGASAEEYTLYCFCEGAQLPNICKWGKAKPCDVSKAAHRRGYGTLQEVWPVVRQPLREPWSTARYVSLKG